MVHRRRLLHRLLHSLLHRCFKAPLRQHGVLRQPAVVVHRVAGLGMHLVLLRHAVHLLLLLLLLREVLLLALLVLELRVLDVTIRGSSARVRGVVSRVQGAALTTRRSRSRLLLSLQQLVGAPRSLTRRSSGALRLRLRWLPDQLRRCGASCCNWLPSLGLCCGASSSASAGGRVRAATILLLLALLERVPHR